MSIYEVNFWYLLIQKENMGSSLMSHMTCDVHTELYDIIDLDQVLEAYDQSKEPSHVLWDVLTYIGTRRK